MRPVDALPISRRGVVPLKRVLGMSGFALLVLAVVLPNSAQLLTAAALLVTALLALPYVRWEGGFARLMLCYVLAVVVTTFFIFIGLQRGGTLVAVVQNFFVYAVSPLLWMIVTCGLLRGLGGHWLVHSLQIMSVLTAITVGVFYFLFLTVGPHAVTFFIDNANLNLKDGYAGATMFVYGSLIFLVGGFFASPSLISGRFRIPVLALLTVVAVTSGRSALLICVPVGLLLGAICTPRVKDLTAARMGGGASTAIKQVVVIFGCCILVLVILSLATDIDVIYIASLLSEKLLSGGGTERAQQAVALANGIASSYGLGAGHGVGVEFVRSGRYPWRYELVWLATLYRVGFLGALVYSLPFIISAWKAWKLWRNARLLRIDVFMLSGMVCALIASNTNPYIEAFVFSVDVRFSGHLVLLAKKPRAQTFRRS